MHQFDDYMNVMPLHEFVHFPYIVMLLHTFNWPLHITI